MPQASTIILADGQATPVNHNFVPLSVSPKQAIFTDRSSVTSAGNNQLVLEFDPARAGRRTNHVRVRMSYPVEHVVDGVTKVAYTARFDGKVILPEELTSAQRDDVLAFIQNALAHTDVAGYVTSLEPVY